ncbi:DUF3343 domain-containing protein [Haloimpatiens lingqiaonensis]|uniref:DUF3343 domain-containing protein n=1 Tax=Haloimpatiens lingqiaonensis TaxID=1380675 RepID=UPI0010FDECAC|nr:DUF3343 domain-containing protein [Haloimpatiens lingqiaonensis]
MDKYYVVTFQNTHEAMNGEKVAKENEVKVQVIPTPTYITKSCGISLKVTEGYIGSIKTLAEEKKINIKNIYLKDGGKVEIIM